MGHMICAQTMFGHAWQALSTCEITSHKGGSITCVMADLFIDTWARLRMSADSCWLQCYLVAKLGLWPRSTHEPFHPLLFSVALLGSEDWGVSYFSKHFISIFYKLLYDTSCNNQQFKLITGKLTVVKGIKYLVYWSTIRKPKSYLKNKNTFTNKYT